LKLELSSFHIILDSFELGGGLIVSIVNTR